jgi:hypothetical protein
MNYTLSERLTGKSAFGPMAMRGGKCESLVIGRNFITRCVNHVSTEETWNLMVHKPYATHQMKESLP